MGKSYLGMDAPGDKNPVGAGERRRAGGATGGDGFGLEKDLLGGDDAKEGRT